MRNHGLCCRLVSIHPSVTLVDCIQMAEDIVKLLSQPGSPSLSFLTPCADTKFQGEPLQWGHKIQGVGIFFLQFSTEITVYLRNGTVWYGTV